MDGCLRVNQQGNEAGEYSLVTSIEDALKIISENTVKPQLKHVVAQLAFGVELRALVPHPNPMNNKWLSNFISTKVDVIKSARSNDKEFQDSMDDFCTKMLGHTMTMNTALAMKNKVLQAIDQIAEDSLTAQ
jgi:hypothetical protein